MNVGEEICGEWLRHKKNCAFVQYGVKTQDQGEIDVLGLDVDRRHVYACEVATHLGGLQYVNTKESRPDNVKRLTGKFGRDIEYIGKYFRGYSQTFMFWAPVVRESRSTAKNNQSTDVQEFVRAIQTRFGICIETVVNDQYQSALNDLRQVARETTAAFDASDVMRYLQIEERLSKHLQNLKKQKSKA